MKPLEIREKEPEEFAASFVSFGVPFRLVTNDDSLLQEMYRSVPYQSMAVSDDASAITFQLLRDDGNYMLQSGEEPSPVEAELPVVLEQLRHDLMVHVAEYAPDSVFVHAGVVGWGGRALVFPGKSHAGKTTLVAELVKAGATYYSDEYAVVDWEGRVHPYARQLQMREPGRPEQRAVTVEFLGGVSGSDALPVGQAMFVQYVPGSTWAPEAMTSGFAVLEMLRHSIPIRRTPARVMSILSRMMVDATAWRSNRGEASDAARAIVAMIAEQMHE